MGVVTRYGGKRIFGGYYTCLLVGVTQQRKKNTEAGGFGHDGQEEAHKSSPQKAL